MTGFAVGNAQPGLLGDEAAKRLSRAAVPEGVQPGAAGTTEALNERALAVMKRMADKLTGRDFAQSSHAETVEAQVNRLILAATSAENLSCSYVGWCPVW